MKERPAIPEPIPQVMLSVRVEARSTLIPVGWSGPAPYVVLGANPRSECCLPTPLTSPKTSRAFPFSAFDLGPPSYVPLTVCLAESLC